MPKVCPCVATNDRAGQRMEIMDASVAKYETKCYEQPKTCLLLCSTEE